MRPLNTPYEYHLSCLGAKAVVVAKTQDEAARKAVQVNKDERLKPILENTLKEFERAGSGQPAAR